MKTIKGCLRSKHKFGRNCLERDGSNYYLSWNAVRNKVNLIITLTEQQYTHIKNMLKDNTLQIEKYVFKSSKDNTYNTCVTTYAYDYKLRYKIKRYLKI